MGEDEDTFPFCLGICPCDAALDTNRLERQSILLEFRPVTAPNKVFVYCFADALEEPQEIDLPSTCPVTIGGNGRINRPVCISYADNHLHLSVDGGEKFLLPLSEAIPQNDYRPCLNLHSDAVRVCVSTTASHCKKRKQPLESSQPCKISRSLWTSRAFADAAVVCGTASFKVHRCVLSAASPFFDRAFSSSMQEGVEARVTIDDADPASVELLLAYLYTGFADLADHAWALLPLAHRLQVNELVVECAAAISEKLDERNVSDAVL